MREPSQFEDPACRGLDTEIFYPDLYEAFQYSDYALRTIRNICGGCAHRSECLEWAMHHEGFGIWAGTTERQRRELRKHAKITLRLPEYNLD